MWLCHRRSSRDLISAMAHTSKGTFLSLAAPVPERMASIKACLASAGLLTGPELALDAVLAAEGARGAGGGGAGRLAEG